MRHEGIYLCVSPCHLQLVSESGKAENDDTNEVESDFKKGTETAEPEKKDKNSCNTNIDHTIDDMFGVTLSDMLDQLELDENDWEDRNPTQIICTVRP